MSSVQWDQSCSMWTQDTDGGADRRDGANSQFSQFCERA